MAAMIRSADVRFDLALANGTKLEAAHLPPLRRQGPVNTSVCETDCHRATGSRISASLRPERQVRISPAISRSTADGSFKTSSMPRPDVPGINRDSGGSSDGMTDRDAMACQISFCHPGWSAAEGRDPVIACPAVFFHRPPRGVLDPGLAADASNRDDIERLSPLPE